MARNIDSLLCLKCGFRKEIMQTCLSRLTSAAFYQHYGGAFEKYIWREDGMRFSALCSDHVGCIGHLPADGAVSLADSSALRTTRAAKRIKAEHAANLTQCLWDARDSQGDFLIKCTDGQARCHSAILSAASPVFASMISSPMKEKQTLTLVLGEEKLDDVEEFLRFVYTGELQSDVNHLNLLAIADKYGFEPLVELCCSRILSGLCVESVVASARALRNPTNERMQKTYTEIEKRVHADPKLCSAVFRAL